jgi:hypothetical protein
MFLLSYYETNVLIWFPSSSYIRLKKYEIYSFGYRYFRIRRPNMNIHNIYICSFIIFLIISQNSYLSLSKSKRIIKVYFWQFIKQSSNVKIILRTSINNVAWSLGAVVYSVNYQTPATLTKRLQFYSTSMHICRLHFLGNGKECEGYNRVAKEVA